MVTCDEADGKQPRAQQPSRFCFCCRRRCCSHQSPPPRCWCASTLTHYSVKPTPFDTHPPLCTHLTLSTHLQLLERVFQLLCQHDLHNTQTHIKAGLFA